VPAAPLTDAERAAPRELVAAERARAQRRLSSLERTFDEMIDAADLEPPDDEGYGVCQRCEQPIGWPRLQAQPGTIRCIRCAASP
jgi:RNA polymerase-binding transcription factor